MYYQEPYLKTFSARVLFSEVTDSGLLSIELDRTGFYPLGGGQPADQGWINGVPVVDVRKTEGIVRHLCEGKQVVEGPVECTIDWENRYDYMQQHTGQHIISAALSELHSCATVSVHMGSDFTTVEIEAEKISEEQVQVTELRANAIICENRHVTPRWTNSEDLPSESLRRPTTLKGDIRLVEIDGVDIVGCGGVHLHRTGEVGLIRAAGEETIRGHARLYWKIGKRAMDDYRAKSQIVKALVGKLSVPEGELIEVVERYETRIKDSQRQADLASQKYANQAGVSLLEKAPIITFRYDDEESDFLKQVVSGLPSDCDLPLCLVNCLQERLQWYIRVPMNMADEFSGFIKQLLTLIDGRGGGRGTLWQGVGTTLTGVDNFFEAFVSFVRDRME